MKKIEKVLIVIILIEIAIIDTIIISNLNETIKKQKQLDKRVKQLEINYKIYELNLSELKEHKEAHFE